ncbi:hypothetical protein D9M73_87290 [compost metagenome]
MLVGQVVDLGLQHPVLVQFVIRIQVCRGVPGKGLQVVGIVKACASAQYRAAKSPCPHSIVCAHPDLAGTAARQAFPVEGIAGIHCVRRCPERQGAKGTVICQRVPVNPRLSHIGGRQRVGDKTTDLVVEMDQLHGVAALTPGNADIRVRAAFWLQQGVALEGQTLEIKLVEGRRHKAGTVRRIHAPGRRQAEAITGKAGAVVAELRIAVIAQVGLPAMPPLATIEPDKIRRHRPLGDGVHGRAVNLLGKLLHTHQGNAYGRVDIVLPGQLVLGCFEEARKHGWRRHDGPVGVHALAVTQLCSPARQQPALNPGPGRRCESRIPGVAAWTVIRVVHAVRIKQARIHLPRIIDLQGDRCVQRVLVKAIPVRVVIGAHPGVGCGEAAIVRFLHAKRVADGTRAAGESCRKLLVVRAAQRSGGVWPEPLGALA